MLTNMQTRDQNFTPRQRQILEQALHILAKGGSKALTMKRVAQGIGFTEAAIYRHFENKRSMLLALYSYVRQGLLEKLSPILVLDSPPADRIRVFVDETIDYLVANRGVNLILLAESIQHRDPELRSAMLSIFTSFKGLVEILLQVGIASGDFKSGIDTDVCATCLAGMILGSLTRYVLEGSKSYSFNISKAKLPIAECFLEGVLSI